jgi:F-type H+-transporting ATPase subunit b
MDQLLDQLGRLVLGSVPTMLLFIALVVAYGYLVRRPLDRVLAERRARTAGAVEQARAKMSTAEAETTAYEDKLCVAKAELFAARDKRLKQWAAEREQALAEARALTQERVKAARSEIEKSAATAREQIEGMSSELSAQILRAVLPAGIQPEATQ